MLQNQNEELKSQYEDVKKKYNEQLEEVLKLAEQNKGYLRDIQNYSKQMQE